jgi:hypothetical protein
MFGFIYLKEPKKPPPAKPGTFQFNLDACIILQIALNVKPGGDWIDLGNRRVSCKLYGKINTGSGVASWQIDRPSGCL